MTTNTATMATSGLSTIMKSTAPARPRAASREPLVNRAVRLLRHDVLSGCFALGERLVEVELAARYQISRHMLREALQALEGEGLVVSDAFRGRSVVNPTEKDIEAMFLVRVALERVAAALAAHRITPSQKKRLEATAALPAEPWASLIDLVDWDSNIHRLVWEIAGEPFLRAQLERIIWPFFRLTPSLEATPTEPVGMLREQWQRETAGRPGSHRNVVAAILQQNAVTAREAMVAHICKTGEFSREFAGTLAAAFDLAD